MRKQIFSLVLTAILVMSCSSSPGSSSEENMTSGARGGSGMNSDNAVSFSGIEGNEWKLIEVYIDGNDTRFSRNTLPEDLSNFFTLNLDGEIISGVGAPNRYSAPYTIGDSQINISLIRSTMMASFFQPENLNEHDFFIYLQNAHEWKLVNQRLELHSKTESGSQVRLVFSL